MKRIIITISLLTILIMSSMTVAYAGSGWVTNEVDSHPVTLQTVPNPTTTEQDTKTDEYYSSIEVAPGSSFSITGVWESTEESIVTVYNKYSNETIISVGNITRDIKSHSDTASDRIDVVQVKVLESAVKQNQSNFHKLVTANKNYDIKGDFVRVVTNKVSDKDYESLLSTNKSLGEMGLRLDYLCGNTFNALNRLGEIESTLDEISSKADEVSFFSFMTLLLCVVIAFFVGFDFVNNYKNNKFRR